MNKTRLIRIGIYFASIAIGLLVAALFFANFRLTPWGFIVATLVFGVLQSLLSPLIEKLVYKYADFLVGGLGLITTFVSLFIGNVALKGIDISGMGTWIGATFVVWLVTAVSSAFLPKLFIKEAE